MLRTVRASLLAGAAIACALALAACTTGSGSLDAGSSAAATASPSKKPVAEPTPTPTIEPVIVVASVDVDGQHVSASGYVQGVIEGTGTCTFVFSREGLTPVSVDHPGTADRMSTACGLVQAPINAFTRGPWTVKLQYKSPTGTFTSEPQTLEVP